jgi:hypothetical protein
MWSMESYIDRRDLSKIISWYCRCTVINKYIIKITLQICILFIKLKANFSYFLYLHTNSILNKLIVACCKTYKNNDMGNMSFIIFTLVYNMIILVELAKKLANTIFIIDGYKCYKYVQNCAKKCEYVFPK